MSNTPPINDEAAANRASDQMHLSLLVSRGAAFAALQRRAERSLSHARIKAINAPAVVGRDMVAAALDAVYGGETRGDEPAYAQAG